MIQVDVRGRVRLVEGPDHHLQAHSIYRVYAGIQNSPERQPIREDGYIVYVLVRNVTYNILKGVGRTITSRRVASVMVDREGRAWTGDPDNWHTIRTTDATLWNLLLEEEDDL